MMAHILPRIKGELVLPPVAHLSTSFYELNASNEQSVLSHLDLIAGIAFAEDIRPAAYPRDLLKQAIAEGKRIRKYFRGDFYVLSNANANPRDRYVMQYHRPDEQDGMVIAFRRDRSPYIGFDAKLFGIDPSADYQATTYRTYVPETPVVLKGTALQRLRIDIHDCPGSAIVEYRKMAQ